MNRPILLLDVHYLCHRAFHTAKGMEWKGRATGVIFGFLQSIGVLMDQFCTDRIVFCFESQHSLRKSIFPGYKRKRLTRERTPEEQEAHAKLVEQIQKLHTEILPDIGFRNVFSFPGYESDDILAAIAAKIPDDEDAIIITADHDLYQCIRYNVHTYNPQARETLTPVSFQARYGISPKRWSMCKAIAGCHSDEVPGVKGVGEITALKFLRRVLDPASKAFAAITSPESKPIVSRNRKLVELPFEGCPSPTLREDQISTKAWKRICVEYGLKSLVPRPPITIRKYVKSK